MSDISFTVDETGESVHADWVDDKNEITSLIPAGAVIVFSASDPTIVTVGDAVVDAAGSGADATLTWLLAGDVTLNADPQDGNGNTLPGFTVATLAVTVTPGEAVGLQISVAGAPPVPVPAAA